jgi:hypothetical protein
MAMLHRIGLCCIALGLPGLPAPPAHAQAADRPAAEHLFVVQVVDEATGRGVPLVQFRTLHEQAWHTDSNGIIAIVDPWLLGHDVFFRIRSHGYLLVADDQVWDEPGKVLAVRPGARATIRMRRINIAERLYRITGAAIYGHSVAAGLPVPIREPLLSGGVTGQDTGAAIPYNGLIYWFWGDTFGLADANFNVSGATAPLPGPGGTDPDAGIDLTYFVDEHGFSRPMLPMDMPLSWVESLMVIRDPAGVERLVATWARVGENLEPEERGVAVFDDSLGVLKTIAAMPADRKAHSSHPVRVVHGDRAWWYLYPHRRVPDDWYAVQDPGAYESYTCPPPGGAPQCSWKRGTSFIETADEEQRAIREGRLHPDAAHFALVDVETGHSLASGIGSIAWNSYVGRWIMIGGGFGEVFYSEADAPEGPWRCARRIVQHDRYNFYNVAHLPFLDRDDGRVIYFEGTYTTGFVQGAVPTPLYDYNQVMYRLSLDDPRLSLPPGC